MAGGYTHITAAQVAVEEIVQRRKNLLHREAVQALTLWKKFFIIGSIAPDYPYMDIADPNSAEWSNVMHKMRDLDFLREGIRQIRLMEDAGKRQKCIAWLFGFAAHVVTDAAIHPVVNLKVGPYEQNKTRHRRCEMSQDVFIHARLNLGVDINQQVSGNVDDTSDGRGSYKMDKDIASLWKEILAEVYGEDQPAPPAEETIWSWAIARLMQLVGGRRRNVTYSLPDPTQNNNPLTLLPPDPDQWHRAMRLLMQTAENGDALIPFTRHLTADQGLVYPAEPDMQYVKSLKIPNGDRMDFDLIFDKTVEHLIQFWADMSLSLQGKSSPLDTMPSVSLDTGIDENNKMIYWS